MTDEFGLLGRILVVDREYIEIESKDKLFLPIKPILSGTRHNIHCTYYIPITVTNKFKHKYQIGM